MNTEEEMKNVKFGVANSRDYIKHTINKDYVKAGIATREFLKQAEENREKRLTNE